VSEGVPGGASGGYSEPIPRKEEGSRNGYQNPNLEDLLEQPPANANDDEHDEQRHPPFHGPPPVIDGDCMVGGRASDTGHRSVLGTRYSVLGTQYEGRSARDLLGVTVVGIDELVELLDQRTLGEIGFVEECVHPGPFGPRTILV